MKQTILILSLLILAPLSLQAHGEEPTQICITIYTPDSAFYQKAIASEKVEAFWNINSMDLYRNGVSATMVIEGMDHNSEITTLKIELEQSCGGEVVEI